MSVSESDFVWITLVQQRLEFCATWAKRRQDNAVERNRVAKNNAPENYAEALAIHHRGLLGEAACMIYLSRAGKPVLEWRFFKDGDLTGLADLDDWIDVKTTRLNEHRLIVQFDDPPHWAYVLARAELAPRICLVGWCYGRDAMHERYKDDPVGGRPAYWVGDGNHILRPMTELRTEHLARQ